MRRLLLVLSVLLLAGCAESAVPASAPATPLPLLPSAPTVQLPDQELDLGSVQPGAPAAVTATGPAVLDLTAPTDARALVVDLDCSACSGQVAVRSVATDSTWGRGESPVTGQYLVDLGADADPRLLIEAEGDWSVRVLAADDIPAASGRSDGTGPVVLRFTEPGRHLWMTADAEVTARAVPLSGAEQSRSFGADGGVEQTVELAGPVLVGLDTVGAWSAQLRP